MRSVYKYAVCFLVVFLCGSIHVDAAAGASLTVVETLSDEDASDTASEFSEDNSPDVVVDISEISVLLQQLSDSCLNIESMLGIVNDYLEYVAGFGLFAVLIILLIFIYKFFRLFI